MVRLSQLDEAAKILDQFGEALQALWPKGAFFFSPKAVSDDKGILAITTRHNTYGYLHFSFQDVPLDDLAILKNGVAMLAVILENIGQPKNNKAEAVLEQRLKERDAVFSRIASQVPGMLYQFMKRADGSYCVPYSSEGVREIFGCAPEDVRDTFDPIFNVIFPEDQNKIIQTIDDSVKNLSPWTCEYRVHLPGKPVRWILGNSIPEKLADGSIVWSGYNTDITEHKRVEQRLKENEGKYRLLTEGMKDVVWTLDVETMRFLYMSPSVLALRGFTPQEVMAETLDTSIMPKDRERLRVLIRQRTADFFSGKEEPGRFYIDEVEEPCRDGSRVWTEVITRFYLNEKTGAVEIRGVSRDISERKRVEEVLRQSKDRYRTIFENAATANIIMAEDTTIILANPNFEKLSGYSRQEIEGKMSWTAFAVEESLEQMKFYHAKRRTDPLSVPGNYECKARFRSGEIKDMIMTVAMIPGTYESVVSMLDITDRKRAEESLRAWMHRYDFIVKASGQVAYEYIVPTGDISWGESIENVLGYPLEEMRKGFTQWVDLLHPEDRQSTLDILEAAEKACSYWDAQYRMRHKNGHYVWIRDRGFFLPGSDGRAYTQLGMMEDITERKRMEEKFMQAQKMEAVGLLAGGVAHDFNNLLQAILGYLELVLLGMEPTAPPYPMLIEVKSAAQRAAELTRQLLAFSRRQVLKLSPLMVNQVIKDLLDMLRRLIGEDIELIFAPGLDLEKVNADKGQFEQVIMNLCVNARDAMSKGGRLIIETGHIVVDDSYVTEHEWVRPGRYVIISITDTGCGMDQETMKQIFEPFFTTKELHKGSGLGLSTVYGIVHQHQGMVHVYSELNKGTCFKVYLPAIITAGEEVIFKPNSAPAMGGTETILLAEDEEQIRTLARRVLENAGYRVLVAADGEEAIRIFREHQGKIDLLFLDVVMPKQSGRAVYEVIRALQPDIKCLFASGYSREGLHQNYVLDSGLHLLQKPYTNNNLLQTIRQILDGKA